MPTTDPLLQGNVLLDIDGVGVVANFSSVSGVNSEVEIVDNPYVNEQGKITIGKLPGKPKTPTVTLKRGLTGATELWDWHVAVMQGTPDRRNGSVILMNTLGEEVLRYNFTNAMVSKISLSEGGATTSVVQIEQRTPASETLIKGGGPCLRPLLCPRSRPSAEARTCPMPCAPSTRSCSPAATSTG